MQLSSFRPGIFVGNHLLLQSFLISFSHLTVFLPPHPTFAPWNY